MDRMGAPERSLYNAGIKTPMGILRDSSSIFSSMLVVLSL
jgi:hypothetical protein